MRMMYYSMSDIAKLGKKDLHVLLSGLDVLRILSNKTTNCTHCRVPRLAKPVSLSGTANS